MNNLSDYPLWDLLPKRETGVSAFLHKYPEYDGRGIVIAIFDSGVDPGAAGLQVTSDGKPKIIGRYDCSGAGDVDTSTVVSPESGCIVGLTGRKLVIPNSWKNPTGKFHLGILNLYDTYPKVLRERIEKERKEKYWDPNFKDAYAKANHSLVESARKLDSSEKSQTFTFLEKLDREEAESQIEVLNALEKKYIDHGPSCDVIVFHDGTMWCVCLDTSESGRLEDCVVVKEFDKSYQYECLTKEDLLNYSVNVYDDGNLVEVVTVSSSHGTHVASIAAAYFPDEPEKNGIAPGAQIISLTIGDNRIGTMETGTAIVRSIIKVMENQSSDNPIRVINMSYGEHANWSCSGRIGELMNEVVDKYGVTWVAAAGNHGPALCTIGTPPDISTNNIIGVGAYVSPEMMVAEYSLRNKAPGLPYTWSSRGPTMDGGRGVNICAPGGAITSVPQYTLRLAQLLNGTSMASPHVAGAVALLLSGLKAQKVFYSPYTVKRALENTAHFMPGADYFAQGFGLLQVEKAFDHLTNYSSGCDSKVRFNIVCGSSRHKGILYRTDANDKPRDYTIYVEPVFADADNIDSKEKLLFQMSIALSCEASWVHHPVHIEMTNLTRSFVIRIDPSGLPIGVHATTLKGFDVKCPDKGPVLTAEITVIRPYTFSENSLRPHMKFPSVHMKPGQILRHFVLVPEAVTYAVLRMVVLDSDRPGNFVIQCIQVRPKQSCKTLEFHKILLVNPQTESSVSFKVKGGLVLEVAIAKFWTEQADNTIDYEIHFQGCRPEGESFSMHHAEGVMSLEIVGGRSVEEVSPTVQLKHNIVVLKPTESKVSPLSKRDIIPPARHIYQLILSYQFHLVKATDVTPNCAHLSNFLYESEYESQLWMLFDHNKQFLACGDAYPSKYTVKLEKGDYTIKQQIRHEKRDLLEKLTDLPMLICQKLQNTINLDVYGSHSQALVGGKKLSFASMPHGRHRLPIYVAPLHNEKSLKNISVGQYLTGTLTISKSELGKKVDTYKFKYILGDMAKKGNSSTASSTKPEKPQWEEYQDALRDLKTNWLSKMESRDDSDKIYTQIQTEFPDHVSAHSSMLVSLEPDSKRMYPGKEESEDTLNTAKNIVHISSLVCDSIDQTKLLSYYGIKSDQRPEASTIKSSMEKQRSSLIDALNRGGAALCRLHFAQSSDSAVGDGKIDIKKIDNMWLNLMKFVDPGDVKSMGLFGIWHSAVHENYGRLVRYVLKMMEEKSQNDLELCLIWACGQLKWDFCADHFKRSLFVKYPLQYKAF